MADALRTLQYAQPAFTFLAWIGYPARRGEDRESWNRLVERLYAPRTRVRELMRTAARSLIPNPFPNWTEPACRVSASKSRAWAGRGYVSANCDEQTRAHSTLVVSLLGVQVLWEDAH